MQTLLLDYNKLQTFSPSSTPVIIPAAGAPRPQVLALSSGIKSASMVPVSGKPVLGWILDELIEQGFKSFFILSIVDDEQIKQYCEWRYKDGVKIRPVPTESAITPKGVGHSIFEGLRFIKDETNRNYSDNVLIVLGHTIYRKNIFQSSGLTHDWIITGDVQEEITRWCYAVSDTSNKLNNLIDKPSSDETCRGLSALLGVYHLCDRDLLSENLQQVTNNNFTEALLAYNQNKKITLFKAEQNAWLDCGSIVGLQKTRKLLITGRARATNAIELDENMGVLTKRTDKRGEILQQNLWYVGVPDKIKPIIPRIYSFEPASKDIPSSTIVMEYYAYSTLEEAWLYKDLPFEVWCSIITHLLEVLDKFRNFPGDLESDDFAFMYKIKTEKRLKKLCSQPKPQLIAWDKLLNHDQIKINNRVLLGWKKLEQIIWNKCEGLYDKHHVSLIHGDFHLGNILYDLNSRLVKLIDPRGSFGSSTIYGDWKYDLAKLRHSFFGGYNYIVNDLFHVEFNSEANPIEIKFNRPHLPKKDAQLFTVQQKVAEFFDQQIVQIGEEVKSPNLLEHVKLIEGLLFLSMIPIHTEHFSRQLAMFTIALERFNNY